MSILKNAKFDHTKWLDEEFIETNYTFVAHEDGDFELFYMGKSVGLVESREALDELMAAHKEI